MIETGTPFSLKLSMRVVHFRSMQGWKGVSLKLDQRHAAFLYLEIKVSVDNFQHFSPTWKLEIVNFRDIGTLDLNSWTIFLFTDTWSSVPRYGTA